LFDLYQESVLRPSILKPIDRSLFDTLLEAGFLLQLIPVVIDIRHCCDYKYEEFKYTVDSFRVHQANFVSKAYFKSAITDEMEIVLLDEEKAKNGHFQYMLTLDGDKKLLDHKPGCKCSELSDEEHECFACAMIVRAPRIREEIEKK